MEHLIFIKLIFWIALFVLIVLTALVCELVDKLLDKKQSLKRKSDAYKAKEVVMAGPDDSLDRLAA